MSKDNKTFQDKLKSFFKTFKSTGVTRPRCDTVFELTDELKADLSHNAPLQSRIRAAKEIIEASRAQKVESPTIEQIWLLVNDLVQKGQDGTTFSKETRHVIFELLTALCESQTSSENGALREIFFNFINRPDHPEDVSQKFYFLKNLTNNGRDISYFEERIGPLLHNWMSNRQIRAIPVADFMRFLLSVIKFHQSFLDPDILSGIIQNVCLVSCTGLSKEDVNECLNVLQAVVCYSHLPADCLQMFVATLCRTVNVDHLCQTSYKTMRNFLGTNVGHSGIYTMCNMMESVNKIDESVIRGAVFYVGTSLWGVKLLRNLKYGIKPALKSFYKALDKKHPVVTFEVILRVQDLVKTNGDILQTITWDHILQIIIKVLDLSKTVYSKSDPTRDSRIVLAVNETLDEIEAVIESGHFCGQISQFYEIVDSCYLRRSATSVERLMEYKIVHHLHSGKPGWISNLLNFCDKHLKCELRPNVKSKALQLVQKICLRNRDTHEEEIIDKVILPNMKCLELESDAYVRQSGVNFLIEFLMESSSKKGHDLLNILEKLVNRPFELQAQSGSDTCHVFLEKDVMDIVTAIDGIIKLFKKKIYHLPSSIAKTAYKILVRHLGHHYKKPIILEQLSAVRRKIFECFFEIRANSLYHLGFPRDNKLVFSSYLAVDHRDGEEKQLLDQSVSTPETPPSTTTSTSLHQSNPASQISSNLPVVTYISLTAACKLVVGSLKKEKDWNVLKLVLTSLPTVLENKALILSKHGNDIEYLANALCTMAVEKNLLEKSSPEHLRNLPTKFSRTDFLGFLYPIFTTLVSYHSHLDITSKQKIVKCLQQGLVSRPHCRMCILALTMCTLEMKDTMHKLLPEVLLALSKITPQVNIAIPLLEFLSTLIHLPRVFASFVQDQYASIFAIALPYTNPFKFHQYTVSLAHHVVALWFIKCRLQFRRTFVPYIIRGLKTNVWEPLEQKSKLYASESRNEDSTDRKRSSSLTDQSQKRRERPEYGPTQMAAGRMVPFDSKQFQDKSLQKFHQELTETCIDFMARYAYADCSPLPTRFNTTNFLVDGGSSQSWIIDNRIITITTSGCTQKELKDGVCDKCFLNCRKQLGEEGKDKRSPGLGRSLSVRGVGDCTSSSRSSNSSSLMNRRRHRSDFSGARNLASTGVGGGSGFDKTAAGTDGKDQMMMREYKDDWHIGQDSVESAEGITTSQSFGGSVPFMLESIPRQKNEGLLCTCWCNGWAEVLIRSPTGNTSWMMRVQNHVGSNTTGASIKDLTAVFLQNIAETYQQESLVNLSDTSSTLSSPTQQPKNLLISQNSVSQDSVLASSGEPASPNVPGSPTTPDSTDDFDGSKSKNPVRRSNSSPEMSSNWKSGGHVSVDKDIEEQEEESSLCSSLRSQETDKKPDSIPNLSQISDSSSNNPYDCGAAGVSKGATVESSSVGLVKGSTSPFRQSYEAIPEENTQKGGSLSASPEKIHDITQYKRDRLSTISVMTPARRNHQIRRMQSLGSADTGSSSARYGENVRSGINPSFVFMQLCAQGSFGREEPLSLPPNDTTANALKVFDYIPPNETHKIGVFFVGPDQSKNEQAILQNQYGSIRYRDFLQGLGKLIKLSEVDPQKSFLGGLSKDGTDGEFACMWQDDVMQVIFHVSTLMPNNPSDPNGNNKKRHIGNDHVAIVYNNSEENYDIKTVKGHFLFAWVIVQPLDHKTNRVFIRTAEPELADIIGHIEAKIVSDQNLPIMARQLALHANLASVIFQKLKQSSADPYASNWLERLRKIKNLKNKFLPDSGVSSTEELSDPFASASLKRLMLDDISWM